jgi:septal ring factor EnvC (AmiA/AmiB activator)
MKRFFNWSILSVCFLVSAVAVIPADALNSKSNEINDLLTKEKKERNKLQARINKQKQDLSRLGKKESSSLKKLRILDDQLKVRKKELNIYNYNMEKNKKKIALLSKRIIDMEQQVSRHRKARIQRLRTIYKEGSLFPIKVLFSSGDFNDLLQRIRYMQIVADSDGALFQKYNKQFDALNQKKEVLLQAREKLLMLQRSVARKQLEIEKEKSERQVFLKRLKKEIRTNKNIQEEQLKSTEDLNRIIARLEQKLTQGEGLDIIDKKGWLPVPVQGRFLNKFGRKRDKQYDTYIVYNGVNIRSSRGTPVRSVFEGNVLYTGTLEGYGNLIILGHGKDYHTLYGHLDEIVATVGKRVRLGQIIGRTGDTGSLVGEALYFEIRHKGKPIEPTTWFQRPKK